MVEKCPLGIHLLDQLLLFLPAPTFELFFTADGIPDFLIFLKIQQIVTVKLASKFALTASTFMVLYQSLCEIVGHTSVKDSSVWIGCDVDVVGFHGIECKQPISFFQSITVSPRGLPVCWPAAPRGLLQCG